MNIWHNIICTFSYNVVGHKCVYVTTVQPRLYSGVAISCLTGSMNYHLCRLLLIVCRELVFQALNCHGMTATTGYRTDACSRVRQGNWTREKYHPRHPLRLGLNQGFLKRMPPARASFATGWFTGCFCLSEPAAIVWNRKTQKSQLNERAR